MDVWTYSTQLVALLTTVKFVVFFENLHEKSGNHRCFWSVYHHNITITTDYTHIVTDGMIVYCIMGVVQFKV